MCRSPFSSGTLLPNTPTPRHQVEVHQNREWWKARIIDVGPRGFEVEGMDEDGGSRWEGLVAKKDGSIRYTLDIGTNPNILDTG